MPLIQITFAQTGITRAAVVETSTANVVIVGFLFVMIVLSALTAMTFLLGAIFSRLASRATEIQKTTLALANPPDANTPAETLDEEDPAIIAVIAAAVHSVVGDRAHRIISVRSSGPSWAQEGRRQIFSSHRVR